jgi:probable HAF family extracellular repeat protein
MKLFRCEIAAQGFGSKVRKRIPVLAARGHFRVLCELVATIALLLFVTVARSQNYTVLDLGTLGGPHSVATGINSSGAIVGFSDTVLPGIQHAFLYSGGTITDLGTLGGSTSYAWAINVNGQITGYSDLSGNALHHAFIFQSGAMHDLVPNSTTSSEGMAINASGQVGGTVYRTSNNTDLRDVFLYSGGTMYNLGTIGGRNSTGTSINNSGVVGGSSDDASNNSDHAVISDNSTTPPSLIDLGVIGAIIAAGPSNTWVGYSEHHAFSYQNGVTTILGSGAANAINSSGVIVGTSGDAIPGGESIITDPTFHAWIYRNGTMTDLNSLVVLNGITLTDALGINDSGEIIAEGSNGHAYALSPTSVPEPPAFAILLGAAPFIVGIIRRKKMLSSR